MHHTARPAHRRVACTRPAASSPLRQLEESFLALAAATVPLTLPVHLVCEQPEQPALPVDQGHTRLAHPATTPVLREQTWHEVVRRAQQLGRPWDTVAVAMTVPVLRRMLARLARPAHLERAEVEQEALAAVATAVHTVDVNAADVGRELFSAADRAVHRLVRVARSQAAGETGLQDVHLGRLIRPAAPVGCQGAADNGGEGDEYAVLAEAVSARAVDAAEAPAASPTPRHSTPSSEPRTSGAATAPPTAGSTAPA